MGLFVVFRNIKHSLAFRPLGMLLSLPQILFSFLHCQLELQHWLITQPNLFPGVNSLMCHLESPSGKHSLPRCLGVLLHQPSDSSPSSAKFMLLPAVDCIQWLISAGILRSGYLCPNKDNYEGSYILQTSSWSWLHLPLGLHWSWLLLYSLLPFSPFHKRLSHGNSLINILHIKLHLRVCFLRNPICATSGPAEEGRSDKMGEKVKDTKHWPSMRFVKTFKYIFNPIEIQQIQELLCQSGFSQENKGTAFITRIGN